MSKEKIVSKTYISIALASAGCGAVHGFCDATGISLPSTLENSLIYAPTLIQGFLGVCDGISIANTGKQATGNYPQVMEGELEKSIKNAPFNEKLYAGLMGGLGEGAAAVFETLVGYGAGYLTGKITKLFS
jgi:hypothetical protein